MNQISVPVAIIGGGISAIWTLAKLRANGISAYLFCDEFLGGEQTMASQGMIHGGQRYSLQGLLTNHASISSKMPEIWQDALDGKSDIKLTKTKILSQYQYLWSPGSLASNITGFFASKVMNAKVKQLSNNEYPSLFSYKEFKGKIYQLPEIVLDIKSLVVDIYEQYKDFIYSIDIKDQIFDDNKLTIRTASDIITAEQFIFSAGLGNEKFLNLVQTNKELYQRRPLKQVIVKDVEDAFYGHAITADPRPRITISAHPLDNGKFCWYLGGLVAARNPALSDEETIDYAYKELCEMFPKINWKEKQWTTLYINRAEPKAENGFLPDEPYVQEFGNVIVTYPTKLTFAPELGERVLQKIKSQEKSDRILDFNKPKIANYPWEKASWTQI